MLTPENPIPHKSIDLGRYFSYLLHWAWLIGLAAVLAGLTAYYVSGLIPPVYQAKTTVLVNEAPSNQAIDYSSIVLSSQLSQTYAQMMVKAPILEEVAKRVGLPEIAPERVSAIAETNMQLITVSAESTNPTIAADIANIMVDVFREQTQTLQTSRFSSYKSNLLTQIDEIEKQIQQVTNQLERSTNQTDMDVYATQLKSYQEAYNTLLQSYEQVQLTEAQISSNIVQIEPATPPDKPISPKRLQNTALAAFVSLLLAAALVYFIEMMDDSLKSPDEFARAVNLPILGMVTHFRDAGHTLVIESQPRSATADAFRTLRTNLNNIADPNRPAQTILITSPMAGDGKSVVTINLACAFAQNGQKVTIIDANLRRPEIHNLLKIANDRGLSHALTLSNPFIPYEYIKSTRINNLTVMTAGKTSPHSSELLGQPKFKEILDKISTQTEIILVDTPPALSIADASVLSNDVDSVILVMKPGSTHFVSARQVTEQLTRGNARVLGIVINDIPLRRLRDEYLHYGGNDYGYARDIEKHNHIHLPRPQKLPKKTSEHAPDEDLLA